MLLELLLLVALLAIVWSIFKKRDNFPPGPLGFPLLGHLPLLGKKPHETLAQWKKTYGPIIGVRFGSYRTVVINDSKLIKEALSFNAFSGRPDLSFFVARSDGVAKGIAFTEGQRWTEQRRFALSNLRHFGFGTNRMKEKVTNEIGELLERFNKEVGKPIQVKNLFNGNVLNALWRIMFDERMKQDDPDASDAFRRLGTTFDDTSFVGSLALFLPWLNKVAPKLSGFEKMMKEIPVLKNFIRKQIEKHNTNYIPDQPRDFVDAYIDEVRKTKDPKSSFHVEHDEMLYTLLDLFIAATETTSTTLAWMCAYLISHPEIQKKLQEEIDQVVGKERLPTLTDRPSMYYTEAVINEVMRFSSIVPFSLFHKVTEDVEFHGFFIPKDTMIIPNLYSAHFDEKLWGDPHRFRPERFLDKNGKYKRNENLIPFSTGKRVCLGESLARDELFLFTTNIFQRFVLKAAGELPSLEPHIGLSLAPAPFEIILTKR